jgi:hypothetical protein
VNPVAHVPFAFPKEAKVTAFSVATRCMVAEFKVSGRVHGRCTARPSALRQIYWWVW